MKYAAIFMIVLVAIGLALGAYTYANARLTVASISLSTAPGVEKADEFAALQSAMDQHALMGTASANTTFPKTISNYFSIIDMLARHLVVVDVEIGLDHWPNLYSGVLVFLLILLFLSL